MDEHGNRTRAIWKKKTWSKYTKDKVENDMLFSNLEIKMECFSLIFTQLEQCSST